MRRILLALCAIAAGCSRGGFSAKTISAAKGELRATINVNPTTLDPSTIQDVETMAVIRNVFEGLVTWDENNKLVPSLAERWEVSTNGLNYTFHLRHGVKFHNGREMNAEDVRFSIDRACDPARNSPTAANYLDDIAGAKERIAGKAQQVTGIAIADPYTLRIKINQPRPYFLGKLTYPCAFVVCKECMRGASEISSISQMIGTGPFKAEAFVPEQQLSLRPFDDYWGGRPKVDRLVELVMKDPQTRLAKFRAGEVQIAGVVRQDVGALAKDPVLGSQLKLHPRPAIAYIAMSRFGYAPFADRRVRRAIAMAVDLSKIEEVLGGTVQIAKAILPPGIEGHRENPGGLSFDPAAAKKELAAAGFPEGKGLPPLELIVRDQTPDSQLVAESITNQLHKNLGIDARPRTMEWRTMLEARNHNKLGFFLLSWYADYLDPQNFLSILLTTGGPGNHFGYSNPEVDKLCAQADSAKDLKARAPIYQQAEDMILQDAPWLPLYYIRDAELVSPNVQGMSDNLLGTMPYTGVRFK